MPTSTTVTLPPLTASVDEVLAQVERGELTFSQYKQWDTAVKAALKDEAAASAAKQPGSFIPKGATKIAGGKIGVKVADVSGWLVLYTGNRRPVSIPADQARTLFAPAAAAEVQAFLVVNAGKFSTGKADTDARKAEAARRKALEDQQVAAANDQRYAQARADLAAQQQAVGR